MKKNAKNKSEFDQYLDGLLLKDKEFSRDYFEALTELPLTTQIGVTRRHRHFTQTELASKMKKPQPRVAEIERPNSNPRLRVLEIAAHALRCHIILVPDEKLPGVARAIGE